MSDYFNERDIDAGIDVIDGIGREIRKAARKIDRERRRITGRTTGGTTTVCRNPLERGNQATGPVEQPCLSTSSAQAQQQRSAGDSTGTNQHQGAHQGNQETVPAKKPRLSPGSTQAQQQGSAGGLTGTHQHGGAGTQEHTPRTENTSGQTHQEEAEMTIKVERCTDEDIHFQQRDENAYYPMSKKSRGRALIIDIHQFRTVENRHGSVHDATNLKELFTQLHFETEVQKNPTATELKALLLEERKRDSHKDAEAFILCVLSHGGTSKNQDYILSSDDEHIKVIGDICAEFDGRNCPNLLKKPKIFIIQACRGWSPGTDVADGATKSNAHLPKHELSDMLIAKATAPDEVSFRNTRLGSRFVRTIVEVFQKTARSSHIAEMLSEVTQRVEAMPKALDMFVQLPVYSSTLLKKLYFFPGYFK